jgi:hypothetical protein
LMRYHKEQKYHEATRSSIARIFDKPTFHHYDAPVPCQTCRAGGRDARRENHHVYD